MIDAGTLASTVNIAVAHASEMSLRSMRTSSAVRPFLRTSFACAHRARRRFFPTRFTELSTSSPRRSTRQGTISIPGPSVPRISAAAFLRLNNVPCFALFIPYVSSETL